MSAIVEIENVSKQYRLGQLSTGTLSHDLNRWWTTRVLGREDPYLRVGEVNDRTVKGTSDYVWALRDINLNIEEGDVVGIIGRNGSGKSTLLKLLSRVTAPTTGEIRVYGRIGSLLEVGTGFHPEMTGLENIYMNGAVLGMTRAEIKSKLDEIVAFSGCERYLDTPVKRYSTGMKVRLGFAVAAHLEPEILVVDEVLAVGDAEFQKKAIGKMEDVSKGGGRTVLFVSHNMTAVKSLCKNAIILQDGLMVSSGDVNTVVTEYLRGDSQVENHRVYGGLMADAGVGVASGAGASGISGASGVSGAGVSSGASGVGVGRGVELLEIGVRPVGGSWDSLMRMDSTIEVYVRYKVYSDNEDLWATLLFKNEHGDAIFTSSGDELDRRHPCGEYERTTIIPANFLNWGNYSIDFYLFNTGMKRLLKVSDAVTFTVSNVELPLGSWMGRLPGDVTPSFEVREEFQKNA